ncbi:hypothetical protein ACOME3_007325 [Neoechinorhynchus agilis]
MAPKSDRKVPAKQKVVKSPPKEVPAKVTEKVPAKAAKVQAKSKILPVDLSAKTKAQSTKKAKAAVLKTPLKPEPAAIRLHPKMLKPANASLNDLELQVARYLAEIEADQSDLKRLKDLYACGAKEISYAKGKKALVLYVPVPLLKKFQQIQTRLVEELEKKMPGMFVVILAKRRILPKPSRKMKFQPKQRRPENRTLTAVHKSWLDEIVYPCEIVGKRTRIRQDGSRLIKIHLDRLPNVEDRSECLKSLYKSITGKSIVFEVPEWTYKDL